MKRQSKFSFLFLAIAAAASIACAAQGVMGNDALHIANAKISLTQAITTAEQHANGKAARAEYEHSKHGWVYEVEVVNGAKVFDVKIDADKGMVISSAEDKSDHDDDHDKQD